MLSTTKPSPKDTNPTMSAIGEENKQGKVENGEVHDLTNRKTGPWSNLINALKVRGDSPTEPQEDASSGDEDTQEGDVSDITMDRHGKSRLQPTEDPVVEKMDDGAKNKSLLILFCLLMILGFKLFYPMHTIVRVAPEVELTPQTKTLNVKLQNLFQRKKPSRKAPEYACPENDPASCAVVLRDYTYVSVIEQTVVSIMVTVEEIAKAARPAVEKVGKALPKILVGIKNGVQNVLSRVGSIVKRKKQKLSETDLKTRG